MHEDLQKRKQNPMQPILLLLILKNTTDTYIYYEKRSVSSPQRFTTRQ